jgi:hypothetical protein
MDQLTRYRQLLKSLLQEYARLYSLKPKPNVETLLICDTDSDNYLLMLLGWTGDEDRVRRTILHVRIRDGKFWIEEDATEHGIATDLMRAKVSNLDVVLVFQPPSLRPHTEFAVA